MNFIRGLSLFAFIGVVHFNLAISGNVVDPHDPHSLTFFDHQDSPQELNKAPSAQSDVVVTDFEVQEEAVDLGAGNDTALSSEVQENFGVIQCSSSTDQDWIAFNKYQDDLSCHTTPYLPVCPPAPCETPCCLPPLYCDGEFYIDHVEGRWIDDRVGYTSVGLFLPINRLATHRFLPFVDFREHYFNDGKTAGNFGLGFRYADSCDFEYFGMNVYYDYRKSSWNHYFQQIGVGFEILGPCWDFRTNGYIPLDEKAHSKVSHFSFEGGFEASCQQHRGALWGFDAELGRWLFRQGPCRIFDLYAGVGWYSYFHERGHHHRHIFGGEARLVSHISRYISLEIRGGYDRVDHGMVQGRVTISIPFENLFFRNESCCESLCGCTSIACQPVYREELIVLSGKQCCWEWNWDDSGDSCSTCGR